MTEGWIRRARAFSVAPMMDWTDRHCRAFHRVLTRRALLYTEMVTSAALVHGDVARLLAREDDHPVALQLGGSDPGELARAARIGADFGYAEINLNCGCPSDRVQRGAFGACLMERADQVAACVAAMRDAVDVPVTVKHRIGLGRESRYEFVRDFVATVAAAGCSVFIVHARNAWLEGLSPRDNRSVPPLRYDIARRLKQEFPALTIVLNGGLSSHAQITADAHGFDGVMVGRAAYGDPWMLVECDRRYFGDAEVSPHSRAEVVERMFRYAEGQVARGVPLRAITRHLLGLYNGVAGARAWRRQLSDARELAMNDPALLLRAAPVG